MIKALLASCVLVINSLNAQVPYYAENPCYYSECPQYHAEAPYSVDNPYYEECPQYHAQVPYCAENPCYYSDCPQYMEHPMPIYYERDPFINGCGQTCGQYLWSSLFNNLGIEVSALYWKVGREDRQYALTQTVTSTTRNFFYHFVKPHENWGWRIGAKYSLPCCSFVDAEYTHFSQTGHDETNNPIAVTTFGYFADPINEMSLQVKHLYQRARARLGWSICSGYRSNLYITGGTSWIYASEQDRINATTLGGAPVQLLQKSWFSGAGLEAGVGGVFQILSCLGAKAEFNGIGAIGNIHNQLQLMTNLEGSPFILNHYPTVTHLIPGIDLCLELFLTTNWFCAMTFAVGYEYHHFFDALLLSPNFGLGGSDKVAFHDTLNIGFGGVYGSIKINY